MGSLIKQSCMVLLVGILGVCTSALAQQYLFTNNNVANSTNSTTALTVNAKGALKLLETYSTGGKSAGSGYFAVSTVTSSKTRLETVYSFRMAETAPLRRFR